MRVHRSTSHNPPHIQAASRIWHAPSALLDGGGLCHSKVDNKAHSRFQCGTKGMLATAASSFLGLLAHRQPLE